MKFTVAVDAMGGDESPLKVIRGLDLFLQSNQDLKFLIFGNRDLINPILEKYPLVGPSSTIVHTNEKVLDNLSPLEAVKNGKNSSMWLALTALKNKNADIAISAGNTAALLVMSRLILETINGIDKPALASMETVKAVRRRSSFSLTMIGKLRSLARRALIAEQMMPDVWRIKNAIS